MNEVIKFPKQTSPEDPDGDMSADITAIPNRWTCKRIIKELGDQLQDLPDNESDVETHFHEVDRILSLLLTTDNFSLRDNGLKLLRIIAQLGEHYLTIDEFHDKYPAIADVITDIEASEDASMRTLRKIVEDTLGRSY